MRFGTAMPIGNMAYVAVEGSHGGARRPPDLATPPTSPPPTCAASCWCRTFDPATLQALAISAGPLGTRPGFALECRRSGRRMGACLSRARTWPHRAPSRRWPPASTTSAPTVQDFATAGPAECGLDKPDLTVTLTGPDGAQTLLLSQRADVCYAMLQGESAPVRVPANLFNALRRPPDDLRERALTQRASPPTWPASSWPARRATWPWSASRTAGRWRAPTPRPPTRPSLPACWTPSARRAPQPSPPRRPADMRPHRVTLRAADGRALAELHLDRSPATGNVYATRPVYRTVLLLDNDERLATLFAGRLGLLARTLLQEPADGAAQVDLLNAAGSFHAAWTDGWRLTAPVNGPADEDAVSDILKDFADLRARASPPSTTATPPPSAWTSRGPPPPSPIALPALPPSPPIPSASAPWPPAPAARTLALEGDETGLHPAGRRSGQLPAQPGLEGSSASRNP